MFGKTLVCLDGSKMAEEILPYIIESCPPSGSEVILFQAVSSELTIPPPESTHAMTFGIDSKPGQIHTSDIGETATLEPRVSQQLKGAEAASTKAGRYLDGIAHQFRHKALKVRTMVFQGEPGESILNYANEQKVSLIALTTHGSGGLKPGTLGSVAQSVLKESEVPVLIIKPKGAVRRK